jgi:hypothetical protein
LLWLEHFKHASSYCEATKNIDTLFDAEKNFAINPEEEIQKALLVTHGGQVLLKRG